MISRQIKYLGLTIAVGIFSYSPAFAADCPTGQLCNIFEKIMDTKGGPLAGGFAAGTIDYNMRFQKKQACQLAGANCIDTDRLNCENVRTSVFSGIVECWNGKDFSLMNYATGDEIDNRNYKAVANLVPNNTDRKLVIAQGNYASGATLMNENGEVIAEGDVLGCETFEAAGEDTVACAKTTNGVKKKSLLKVSDLEAAKKSSAKVSDLMDNLSINLCSVALQKIEQGKSDSWIYNMKSIKGVGSASIDIYKKKSDLGNTCVIYPENKPCTAIYLNKDGLECRSFGALVFKRPMKVSAEELVNTAKTYVFKGKEIVPMTDVYAAVGGYPAMIRVDRPDYLIGSTPFIRSSNTAGSSHAGTQ